MRVNLFYCYKNNIILSIVYNYNHITSRYIDKLKLKLLIKLGKKHEAQ